MSARSASSTSTVVESSSVRRCGTSAACSPECRHTRAARGRTTESDVSDPDLKALEQRILVLAPTGRDAALTRTILEGVAITCESHPTLDAVCDARGHGAGAVLLAEEAVGEGPKARLADWIAEQRPWSDLPILVV